jgi:hypothetical protein
MKITNLFKTPKVVGIVGNPNEAKSNLIYHIIEELKKEGSYKLFCYGLRKKIPRSIEIYSITELEQIKNSIVILDEVMSLWDLNNRMAKRQIENTLRLIYHNNNILIVCAIPENVKKFIAGKFDVLFLKKITLGDLINGSRVKRIVMDYKGSELGSSVLNLSKQEALIYDGTHYHKIIIPYYKKYDSKLNKPKIVNERVNKNVQ